MRLPLAIAAAAIAAALLLPASPARADTYCVAPRSDCDHTLYGTVGAALAAAAAHAGPDGVRLPATPSPILEDGVTYNGDDPVDVSGAGRDATTLSFLPAPAGTVFYGAGSGAVTLHDLTIRVPSGGDYYGAWLSGFGSEIRDARVTVAAPMPTSVTAVQLDDGAVRNTTISFAGTSNSSAGINTTGAGSATIEDVSITGPAVGLNVAGSSIDARRVRIDAASSLGAEVRYGALSLQDALITTVSGATGLGAYAGSSPAALDARHVTVVGSGAYSNGVVASSGAAGAATVALRDSIVRGFGTSLRRGATGSGAATMAVRDSDVPTGGAAVVSSGPGSLTTAPNVVDVDPLFRNVAGGDYRLTAASPLVDRDSDPPGGSESATDLGGLPRVIRGARDLGAYETAFAPSPGAPVVSAIGRTGLSVAATVNPNGAAGTWRVRYGTAATLDSATAPVAYAAGAAPQPVTARLEGLRPGSVYSLAVEATGPEGTATGPAVTVVTVADPPGAGPSVSPGAVRRAPPRLSRLSIVPLSLRVRGRGASTGRRGARVRFRLDRDARVTFTVRRRVAGVRRGRGCRALRRGARRPARRRRCTALVRMRGSFAVTARAGARSVVFTGRLGGRPLPRGHYVLTASPRSAGAAPGRSASVRFVVR